MTKKTYILYVENTIKINQLINAGIRIQTVDEPLFVNKNKTILTKTYATVFNDRQETFLKLLLNFDEYWITEYVRIS